MMKEGQDNKCLSDTRRVDFHRQETTIMSRANECDIIMEARRKGRRETTSKIQIKSNRQNQDRKSLKSTTILERRLLFIGVMILNGAILVLQLIPLASTSPNESHMNSATNDINQKQQQEHQNNDLSETRRLLTNVGHVPRFVHQPASELVRAGDPKTIECPVEAEPEPEVRWFRAGRPVVARPPHLELTGNELMFIAVGEQDAGEYHCEASNALGSVTSDPFKLSIQTSFHDPQMSFEPRLATVQADRLAAFTCSIPEANNNNNVEIFFRKNNERLPVRWIESSLNLAAGDNLNQIRSLGERYLARALPAAATRAYQLLIVGASRQSDDNATFSCLYKEAATNQDPLSGEPSGGSLAHESHSVQLRVTPSDAATIFNIMRTPSPPPITLNDNLNGSPEITKLDDSDLASPIDNLANSQGPRQIITQQHNKLQNSTTKQQQQQLTDLSDNNLTTISNSNNNNSTIPVLLSSQNLTNLYELLKPALFVGAVFALIANTLLWAQWLAGKWRRRSKQYKKHHPQHAHLGHHAHYSLGASSGSSSNASSMLECDPVLKSLMGRTLSTAAANCGQQRGIAQHQSSSSLLLAQSALGKKYRSYRDSKRCKVGAATSPSEFLHQQQPWSFNSNASDLVDNLLQYQANPLDEQQQHQNANLPNLYNQSLAAREQARNLLFQVNEQTSHMRSLNNIYSNNNNPISSTHNTARDFLQRLTGLRSSVGGPITQPGSQLNLPHHETHQLWTTTNSRNNNNNNNKKIVINNNNNNNNNNNATTNQFQFRPNHLIGGQQTLVGGNASSCGSATNDSAHSPSSLDLNPTQHHNYNQKFIDHGNANNNNSKHQSFRSGHETRLQSSSNHYSTIEGSLQTPGDYAEACYEELDEPRENCSVTSNLEQQQQQSDQVDGVQASQSNQQQQQLHNSGSSRNSSTRTTSTFVSSGLTLDLHNPELGASGRSKNGKRPGKKQQQQADQLSPYAVSSIVCPSLSEGQNKKAKINGKTSGDEQQPPPMSSEAMRALNEQFNINQLLLMGDQQDGREISDQARPVRQLIANFNNDNESASASS